MKRAANEQRAKAGFALALVSVIVATHAWALLAFGPVFWIDSVDYVNLAEALRTGTLNAWYSGIGGWVFSHLQPGLPLTWLATATLFAPEHRWLAVAVFQHAAAAAALGYFALTVHRYWPTRLHLVAVALLCLLPFYQALHDAILTESLSSSLLLFAFALAIRLIREPRWHGGHFAALLACLLVATQFRSYFGVFVGILGGVALLAHRAIVSARTLALLVSGLVAIAAFPAYRYVQTGMLLLPSGGINSPIAAFRFNVQPGARTENALQNAGLPASLPVARVMEHGIDYPEALSMARHWTDLGLDVPAVNRRAVALGRVVSDESADVLFNRAIAGLASCGSIAAFAWLPGHRMVFRQYDVSRMYEHQKNNYLYLSWQSGDVRDASKRLAVFDQFFVRPHRWDDFAHQRTSKAQLSQAMRARVATASALPSDPLRLAVLPPDLWFALGVLAIVALAAAGERAIAAGAALLVAANFLVAFSFPLGNTRYAYSLFPLYFLLVPVAIQAHRAGIRSPRSERMREYFYDLLSRYLSLRIRPENRVVEIEPATDALIRRFPRGRVAFRDRAAHGSAGRDREALGLGEMADYDPDYVLISGLVHYERDLQALLGSVRKAMPPGARLIVVYYSSLWRPLMRLASRLGWRRTTTEPNWLAHQDIENLLRLADFEPISRDGRILIPAHVPLLAGFVNRWLAPLPVFRLFALANVLCARPVPAPSLPDTPRPSVSIVVPARNEAGNIRSIVERIPQMGPDDELIFVEGNSTDSTWETIEEVRCAHSGPPRIRSARQRGKGKGDAVRLGFEMAEREILMILDADMTVPPEDLPKFYEAIVSGKGEFINGSRLVYPMERRAMRFVNLLGNKFFATAFSFVLGQRFKDTLCGTKVLSRENYRKLAANRSFFGEFDPFGDFDLIFGASRMGLRIVEIPIRYRERVYGETNIARWRHGAVLLAMLAFAARRIKFL